MTILQSKFAGSAQDDQRTDEDLTESILHALNTTVDDSDADMPITDDMDQATVGKVLAESVMKQLLAKSILYEPMKVHSSPSERNPIIVFRI